MENLSTFNINSFAISGQKSFLSSRLRSLFTINLRNVAGSSISHSHSLGEQFSNTISASIDGISSGISGNLGPFRSTSGLKICWKRQAIVIFTTLSQSPASGISVSYTGGVYIRPEEVDFGGAVAPTIEVFLAMMAGLTAAQISQLLNSGNWGSNWNSGPSGNGTIIIAGIVIIGIVYTAYGIYFQLKTGETIFTRRGVCIVTSLQMGGC